MSKSQSVRILETKRMVLRTFVQDDLENLVQMHTDEEVMRFLVGGMRTSREAVKKDLVAYIEHQEKYKFGKWAIIDKTTNEFMGRAGLVFVPETGEVDLGYAFHKKYWGQGYATEIAMALLTYAQSKLPQAKLVGLVSSGNFASAKVLEKIGFRFIESGKYFETNFEVYRIV